MSQLLLEKLQKKPVPSKIKKINLALKSNRTESDLESSTKSNTQKSTTSESNKPRVKISNMITKKTDTDIDINAFKQRLKQRGLLKRFSVNCYGKHKTLENIRSEKTKLYKTLKDKKLKSGDKEFDRYFLRYIPNQINNKTKKIITK